MDTVHNDDPVARVMPRVLLPFQALHLVQVAVILSSRPIRDIGGRVLFGFAALLAWFLWATVGSLRSGFFSLKFGRLAPFSTMTFMVAVLPELDLPTWQRHGTWLGIACADCVIGLGMLEKSRLRIAVVVVLLIGVYAGCVAQIDGFESLLSAAFLVTASNIVGVVSIAMGMAALLRAAILSQANAEAELASTKERIRLHRLIHDAALQPLDALAGGWDIDLDDLRANARQQAALLRAAIRAESGLDELVLSDRLQVVAQQWQRRGLQIRLCLGVDDTLLSPRVADAIAAAANEALANVFKHAGVRTAELASWVRSDRVHVSVTDEGAGYETDTQPEGLGMSQSIRSRLDEVRGGVHVESAPNSGTKVVLWVPT